jgi:hypothetical protein
MSGPLRAAWLRPSETLARWSHALPVLISAAYVLSVPFSFSEYANAFGSPWAADVHSTDPADVGQSLGVAGILVQTTLLMGFSLVLLRRWTLSPGITLTGILAVIQHSQLAFVPVALVSGLLGDLLNARLQPREFRVSQMRAFAFLVPAAMFALYFLAIAASGGVGWSVHLWAGSIALAGVMGLLLSYLAASPALPTTTSRA